MQIDMIYGLLRLDIRRNLRREGRYTDFFRFVITKGPENIELLSGENKTKIDENSRKRRCTFCGHLEI